MKSPARAWKTGRREGLELGGDLPCKNPEACEDEKKQAQCFQWRGQAGESRLESFPQPLDAHDVDDSFHVIGQGRQAELGAHFV